MSTPYEDTFAACSLQHSNAVDGVSDRKGCKCPMLVRPCTPLESKSLKARSQDVNRLLQLFEISALASYSCWHPL